MMSHFWFAVNLLVAAGLFAKLEIHVEGADGWASKLPTWRLDHPLARLLLDGKPLTGYHLYALMFTFWIVHLPFARGVVGFSWAVELRVLSFFVWFWLLEDFLWFVLNPAFGLSRFRPDAAWWHGSAWWGVMPRSYYVGMVVGTGLYVGSWVMQ